MRYFVKISESTVKINALQRPQYFRGKIYLKPSFLVMISTFLYLVRYFHSFSTTRPIQDANEGEIFQFFFVPFLLHPIHYYRTRITYAANACIISSGPQYVVVAIVLCTVLHMLLLSAIASCPEESLEEILCITNVYCGFPRIYSSLSLENQKAPFTLAKKVFNGRLL